MRPASSPAASSLAPGTWDVTAAPTAGDPVTRRVTVQPAAGLSGTLRLEGGQSYLELDQDGAPVAGVSGSIAEDGNSIPLAATQTLRIRAGNAGATRLTINGISIGAMGAGWSGRRVADHALRQLKGTGKPWQESHRSTW